jgi:superfamily II DNA/RNA helicase
LSDKFLSNPKTIEVARPASTNINITQKLVEVDARKKRDVLRDLLISEDVKTAIIFCNRKTTVRELAKSLQQHKFRASEIHGDMDQSSRIKELDRFKSGDVNILVASDVAARGLDVKGVSHVFNFDAPWHPDDYVHRIGRTGRAGAMGAAFTFVTSADAEAIDNIEKLTGQKIDRVDGKGIATKAGAIVKADTAASAEKPARAARTAREPRQEREPRPARTARPERTPRPAREPAEAVFEIPKLDRTVETVETRSPQRAKPALAPETADDGWNGPVPAFLGFSLPN